MLFLFLSSDLTRFMSMLHIDVFCSFFFHGSSFSKFSFCYLVLLLPLFLSFSRTPVFTYHVSFQEESIFVLCVFFFKGGE